MPESAAPHQRAHETPDHPSFEATGVNVSLTVDDLGRSLAWYQGVVGFAVDRKFEREGRLQAVSLRAGEVRILIGQDDGARGSERIKGVGFSIQLTTAQSIDEIAGRIKASGATLDTEVTDTPWGARMFRVRDPDGFKLTISS